MLDLLKFDITARNSGAKKSFAELRAELGTIKGAVAGVNDYAQRLGRSMRNIGAGLSAGVTAPLALLGKQSLSLYDAQLKAERAVAQAITSTGSAAGKSLEDLKGYASGLQAVTTFGDEDILQNVTAPLLTFTKIQGDVFNRAQANVLDMATLLKMDLKSASVLVGKALNDPIKGITALSRSGVQFSEDQKKVIKALVETGDVAGAQALILDELETQFMGQAAAAATTPLGQLAQLRNAIGDVKEQLGEQIAPFLKPLVEQVKSAIDWFSQLSPEVRQNIVVIGGLVAAVGPVVGVMGLAAMGIGQVTLALGALATLAMAHPILLLISAIVGGAILIYRNWEGISGWFAGLWERVRALTSEKWEQIKAKIAGAYQSIVDAWGNFTEFFRGIVEPVIEFFENLGSKISEVLRLGGLTGSIVDDASVRAARRDGVLLMDGVAAGIRAGQISAVDEMHGASHNMIDAFQRDNLINSPSKLYQKMGGFLMTGLADGIAGGVAEVTGALESVTDKSLNIMTSLRDGAKRIFTDVLTGAGSFRSSLASVLGGFGNSLINSGVNALFDAVWPNAKGNVFSGGKVTAFAKGGVVSGTTLFPMSNGIGMMGEEDPEAIMPLARGSDGKLGVRAQGGGRAQVEVALLLPEGVTMEAVRQVAGDIAVTVTGSALGQYSQGFGSQVQSYGERGTA